MVADLDRRALRDGEPFGFTATSDRVNDVGGFPVRHTDPFCARRRMAVGAEPGNEGRAAFIAMWASRCIGPLRAAVGCPATPWDGWPKGGAVPRTIGRCRPRDDGGRRWRATDRHGTVAAASK